VTEALLTLLDCYDEPVIPFHFYQRCIDASDESARSHQVLYMLCIYVIINHKALMQCLVVFLLAFYRSLVAAEFKHQFTHNTHPFYGPLDFVWDYPGEPVPER